MTGLIVGRSPVNGKIKRYIEQFGHQILLLEDPARLRRLDGQIGDFTALIDDGAVPVGFVVFTQPKNVPPPVFDGVAAQSLTLSGKTAQNKGDDPARPLVFLLDFGADSSLAATLRLLSDAKTQAERGRKVFCLFRSIRTAGRGAEPLYQQARAAGASFLRYDTLQVAHSENEGLFHLSGEGGGQPFSISAKRLYADNPGGEPNAAYQHCLEALRIRPGTSTAPEGQYYLGRVCTSRRGVYRIGEDDAAERLSDLLGYIAAEIVAYSLPTEKTADIAEIDGAKCAFCLSCYRACPHGALQPGNENRQMQCLSLACRGCGICAGICPGGAITMQAAPSWPKALSSGSTLVLCCENSAALAMPQVLENLHKKHPNSPLVESLTIEAIPCGGSITLEDLTNALLRYDKILVATCMEGACQHFEGSTRAARQCARLLQLLESAELPQGRVRHTGASHAMPLALEEALLAFWNS